MARTPLTQRRKTKTPLETSLTDPLRDLTRKERRHLLSVSLGAILVAKAGLVPTEIAALGIKLTPANKSAFLFVIAAVNVYYLAQFLVYGARDLLAWTQAGRAAAWESAERFVSEEAKRWREEIEKRIEQDEEYRKQYVAHYQELEKIARSVTAWIPFPVGPRVSTIIAWAVTVFEFIIPAGVALYAIIAALLGA